MNLNTLRVLSELCFFSARPYRSIVVTVILHVLEAQPFGREGGSDHAAAAQLALRRAQVASGRAVGRDRVSRRLGEERDQYLVGVWG